MPGENSTSNLDIFNDNSINSDDDYKKQTPILLHPKLAPIDDRCSKVRSEVVDERDHPNLNVSFKIDLCESCHASVRGGMDEKSSPCRRVGGMRKRIHLFLICSTILVLRILCTSSELCEMMWRRSCVSLSNDEVTVCTLRNGGCTASGAGCPRKRRQPDEAPTPPPPPPPLPSW